MKAEWLEMEPANGNNERWILTVDGSDVWGTVRVQGWQCLWSVTIKGLYDYAVGGTTSVPDAKRQCLEALKRYHAEIVDALSRMEKQEEPVA